MSGRCGRQDAGIVFDWRGIVLEDGEVRMRRCAVEVEKSDV